MSITADLPQTLWHQTAQETVQAPPLLGEVEADLVIIGGGYTGCSAALRAAELGAEVCLLEADTLVRVAPVAMLAWSTPDCGCHQSRSTRSLDKRMAPTCPRPSQQHRQLFSTSSVPTRSTASRPTTERCIAPMRQAACRICRCATPSSLR